MSVLTLQVKKTNFNTVKDFHRKFGLPTTEFGISPEILDDETFLYRYQFLQEELQELLQAHRNRDLVEVSDALADLVYVTLGTAHLYGIPFDEIFTEVHRTNMEKMRISKLTNGQSKRASVLDVIKPEGWQPPNIFTILKQAGMKSK